MAGNSSFVELGKCLAAAAVLWVALAPLPAGAQILDPQRSVPEPPARPKAPPPDIESRLEQEQQEAFSDGRWGTSGRPSEPLDFSPGSPSAAPTAQFVAGQETLGAWDTATEDEAAEEEPADVIGQEVARLKRTLPVQDGDAVPVGEPLALPDGAIDLAESYPLASEVETPPGLRNPLDIAAFSGVDAGFDPLLLEAVETNPIFSGRAVTLGVDPFLPIGTRIGSFILFNTIEADGDYNSNVFASPEALGDYSLEVRPAARLVSNWSTHAVEVRASGDLSFHDRFPSEDDRAYLVEGLGRLDITRRTNLQGYIGHEEAQESRSAINAISAGTRPDIVVNRGRAAFNHRFNRLTVQLRGAIVDTRYGNDILGGVTQSNADRDYTLYEEAVRPQWEFKPTLYAFTDVAVNQREYSIPAFTDGILRSSTGQRYRVGVAFGNTGAFLRGDVSLGYGRQTPDSPELPIIDGLLIDGNLTWIITPLTQLLLTATSEVAETTTAGSGGVFERTYAAVLSHNFSTRLVGNAGVGYFTRNFVGADLFENQFTAATGLEYYLNRNAVLFGRYEHTAFNTDSFNGNYTAEEVQLGVRLRQ